MKWSNHTYNRKFNCEYNVLWKLQISLKIELNGLSNVVGKK